MASHSGRVVVLTGAAGGIGSVITGALLADGHSIAAVDSDEHALERLCTQFVSTSDRLHPIVADLALETACRDAVASTADRFGRIEAVINNAGIGVSSIRPDAELHPPGIEELGTDTWDRFFAINVRAPMLLVRAALPCMKASGWGRIVNNTTSYRTMLRILPYGATKAALEAMSAIWAEELRPTGITVNVLIPGGPTDTAFVAEGSGFARERMLKPEIMGPPAAWLMSNESYAITGQRISAAEWDGQISATDVLARAGRPVGWPELAKDVVWPDQNI